MDLEKKIKKKERWTWKWLFKGNKEVHSARIDKEQQLVPSTCCGAALSQGISREGNQAKPSGRYKWLPSSMDALISWFHFFKATGIVAPITRFYAQPKSQNVILLRNNILTDVIKGFETNKQIS